MDVTKTEGIWFVQIEEELSRNLRAGYALGANAYYQHGSKKGARVGELEGNAFAMRFTI